MKTKYFLKLVLFIVLTLIIIQIVSAGYDDPGDDWGTTPEEGDTEEESGEDVIWGSDAESGEESQDTTSAGTEEWPTYDIYLGMRIYCHAYERDPVTKFVVDEETEGTGHMFDSQYIEKDTFFPLFPLNSELEESIKYFKLFNNFYIWGNSAPSVELSINVNPDTVFDNAKMRRYEGIPYNYNDDDNELWQDKGCVPFVGFLVDFTNGSWIGFDALGRYQNEPVIKPYYYQSLGYSVEWDKYKEDCEAINGSWYEDSAFEDGGGNYYQCCGDDRMWLYNRAVTENDGFDNPELSENDNEKIESGEKSWSSFCLYGSSDLPDDDDLGLSSYDTTTNHYLCSSTGFSSYDLTRELDDSYDFFESEDSAAFTRESPYVFQGISSEDETDIGKWSDASGQNPQFCYYAYDDSLGETYNWIDINTIGDMPVNDNGETITDFSDPALRASTICEQYLGGKWTGSRCCGNKYDYDNSMYVDESYSETTPIYQNDGTTVKYRYACLQGEIYNTGSTAQYAKDDGTEVELLNSEGNWSACNADTASIIDDFTNTQFISSDKNVTACAVVSSYLCNYNPDTSAWEWYSTNSGEEGSYVRNTLRYSSGEFTLSTAEWAEEGTQTQACCAGNTCWDGAQCVDEYTEHTYNVDDEEVVSVCHQGTWTGPLETKYDWYYNTDGAAVDYCVDSFSCICSSNEEDDTYCAPEGEYFTAGCTLEPNFYVNDHLCEQTTDSSRWTSRTKLLAFQLMQIAERTEYVLFCDAYSNTLNNYVDVASIAEDINSFCVLKQDNTVTIGVTFNSGDAEQPMAVDADDILFSSSNAFVDIIDEDISDCDAIEADQTQTYGEYFSCDSSSNNLFYNNILNSLIYSKDGLTTVPYITNMSAYQAGFDAYKATMTDYIAANDITNPANNNLNDEFEAFNNIQDYNTIYYNTGGIFGFQEIKYTEDAGNRYFMGVVYTGMTPNCSQVYAPYETTELISCVDGIVLERSTSSSEYWTSLTAGLREE